MLPSTSTNADPGPIGVRTSFIFRSARKGPVSGTGFHHGDDKANRAGWVPGPSARRKQGLHRGRPTLSAAELEIGITCVDTQTVALFVVQRPSGLSAPERSFCAPLHSFSRPFYIASSSGSTSDSEVTDRAERFDAIGDTQTDK